MRSGTAAIAALVLTALLPGCYVWVDREPRDPERSYNRALARIHVIEARSDGEKHSPHSVKLWLYEKDEDRVVKASVPLWALRIAARHADDADEEGQRDLDRFGITIDELLDRPEGLVLQAWSEDERVLIWLD
ncbi:MAG TPA: hypothetical protein VNI57_13355 [Candidatus Saccharimonadales bacterium]|nr:hypothetical protein [Candidatus Saccharimonadales bacterium]